MIKKATVTSANLVTDQNGQPKVYNGNYGTMYFHSLTFDNGDKGEYMSKSVSQDKFVVGQETEYELTPNTNPAFAAKIKPVQSNDFKGGKKREASLEGFAARYATDILIAYINNGHKVQKSWFTEWADFVHAWMSGKNVTPPSLPPVKKPKDLGKLDEEESDDLPF